MHMEYVSSWAMVMEKGLINGRPYSQATINDYKRIITNFLDTYGTINRKNLERAMMLTDKGQVGKRFNLFKAVVCFAKYLVREGAIEEKFLKEVQYMNPKYNPPKKQDIVTTVDLSELLKYNATPATKAILKILASTGMRVSELCNLSWENVDLDKRELRIVNAKCGSDRTIGIPPMAHDGFLTLYGMYSGLVLGGIDRVAVWRRLTRLGAKHGLKLYPHLLRHSFVTTKLNEGRPIHKVQKVVGHKNISTTMLYNRTLEQEIVDDMKDW